MRTCSSRQTGRGYSIPNPRVSQSYSWDVLAAVIRDLGDFLTPDDLTIVNTILRNRDVAAILKLAETWGLQSINLMHGGTVATLAARYQLAMLLKRFPFDSLLEERKETAKRKFRQAEETCLLYNNKNWLYLANPASEDTTDVFTYARSFIHRVLGDMPEFFEVVEWSRHGPGATLSTQSGFNSTYNKYADWPYDVTKAASGHARLLIATDERWLGALEDSYRDVMEIPKHHILDQRLFWLNVFNVVKGNKVTFVPKDALQERTIAIEPTMNLCLQLGVDGFIRRRLTSFGVDLNSQEKNRLLAERGSRDGRYATLDLKAASDSISLKICRLLLPPLWYNYLCELRSPTGELSGEVISYEKISSMGNGYTFALESLIFASVIYGVTKHYRGEVRSSDFAVFGDDLVIDSELAPYLVFYLGKFGFTVNPDKTFIQGPVRESCGTDWFNGLLIRPVFLTEFPSNSKQVFSARNRLRRKLEIQWGLKETATVKLFDRWVPEKLLGLIGPPSNEEFDTYRHMDYPYGIKYSSGHYWPFKRLVVLPKAFKGRQFFFRKLMTRLMPVADPPRLWEGLNVSKGSCFDVTKRNTVTPRVVTSRAFEWPDEYLA